MRLIWATQDSRAASLFAQELNAKGIQTSLDPQKVPYQIWVYDEEKIEEAKNFLKNFLSSFIPSPYPNTTDSPKLDASYLNASHSDTFAVDTLQPTEPYSQQVGQARGKQTPAELFLQSKLKKTITTQAVPPTTTRATNSILFLCCFFFISSLWLPPVTEQIDSVTHNVTTPVSWEQLMYFDYPLRQQQIDSVITQYGKEVITAPKSASEAAKQALQKAEAIPEWQGMYTLLLETLSNKIASSSRAIDSRAPLFESLRKGEWWRLVSPIFLHGDIIHLLFNMLWLLLLAPQIENKIGIFRFLLLTLFSALGSNMTQYLMSGPAFIGFSGVICAYAGFLWMRIGRTPWEGYAVQPGTFSFLFWFIGVLCVISVASFAISALWHISVPMSIANAAHISGLLLGMFFGSLDYFGAVREDEVNNKR